MSQLRSCRKDKTIKTERKTDSFRTAKNKSFLKKILRTVVTKFTQTKLIEDTNFSFIL